MDKLDQIKIIQDQNNDEIVMVRVDKTIKELMVEEPSSRWDVGYWHPRFESIMKEIEVKVELLENLLSDASIAFPDCVRESRGESFGDFFETYYFRVSEFLKTGYDYSKIKKCSDEAAKRLIRTKIKKDNVLIARSGVTLGSTLIISQPPEKSCTGDLFVLDFTESSINPYYFTLLMKSKFGKCQFKRFLYGTGSPKISIEHIKALRIPCIESKIQIEIKKKYKVVLDVHDKAIELKKNNETMKYLETIEYAENLQMELIQKVESIIKGEKVEID